MADAAETLTDALGPSGGIHERWVPGSTGEADWAARKAQEARTRAAEVRAEAQQIIDKAQAWATAEADSHETEAAFFESRLGLWLERLLEEDPSGKKSRRLPCGATVKRTSGRESVVVEDETALLAWLEVNRPEIVTVRTEQVWKKGDVAKAFDRAALDDLGRARLVNEDGEPVPGVRVEVGPDRYRVVTS